MTSDPVDRRALLKNALVALEEMQAKLDAVEQAKNAPIAIVGLSCRFPGGANDPEAYWNLLRDGVDAVTEVPANRWDVSEYAGTAIWYGGFLDQVDQFDPQFFGISAREASTMDPQQRLVLEVGWEALERAGIAPDSLNGSATGVFLGITTNDYLQLLKQGGAEQMDVYTATGSALNAAAGRLSYTLGLQGPCMAIDTACSSSLVAIHQACNSLRTGESNLAIAGGVNALLIPEAFIVFAKWGMMAPDGHCKTFDARADGFVRSEGCGMIVLKRLDDALADGDKIFAVIRGSAVNQDGHSSGLTVPNGRAQQAVVRKALENAHVNPADVSYVEAHGTGTSLGDPIEVEALGEVLGKGRSADQPLTIGSVKTNIGHCESASGIAGLIKTVLAMQHEQIPPHLHFQERSPRIPWPAFPVNIPTELTPWPAGEHKRIAGVSSFGFSGVNAHVVLEEAPVVDNTVGAQYIAPLQRPTHILTLSARSENALREMAQKYADHFVGSLDLADTAFTANTGRANFQYRLGVIATDSADAREKLTAFANGEHAPGLVAGDVSERPKIAFLFTGQGAQYVGMGRQLYDTQPIFRAALDQCDELLRPFLKQPLLSVLYPDMDTVGAHSRAPLQDSLLDDTTYTQPALFALEYALAQLWRSWGVEPSIVMGHSVGEYVAAVVAGLFSLEDGIKLIAERARLMGALPAGGQMAAVFADEQTVKNAIAPFAKQVSIGAINGPDNIVISGAGEAVQQVIANLKAQSIKSRALNVSHAFHSPLMESMLNEFERVAASVTFNPPKIKLISNVTGQAAGKEVMTPAYWRRHVREGVRFADGMATLAAQNFNIFVEIGPSPTLIGMGQRCISEENGLWLPSLRKGRDEWGEMLSSLGELFVHGANIDWAGFDHDTPRRKVDVPTYPFQRARYWVETPKRQISWGKQTHPLLGARLDLAHLPNTYVWQSQFDMTRLAYLDDHRVQGVPVLPATAYVEMAMKAAIDAFDAWPLVLTEIENKKMMLLPAGVSPTVQVVLAKNADDSLTFTVYSRREDHDAWTLNATGKLQRTEDRDISQVLGEIDLQAVMARCGEEMSGEDFYRQMSEKGNQWGSNFQGIERLWRGNGEALSLVRVPAGIENDFHRYQFHPAVSDSCGHVLTATISMEKSDDEKGGAFVGGGIDATYMYKHPETLTLWNYARLRPSEGDDSILIGDVVVFDENGTLVSETIGARLWYLDHKQQRDLLDNVDDWFYQIAWEAQEKSAASTAAPGKWLILADRGGVGENLAARIHENGGESVIVYADETENIADLLDGDLRGIVHLWSLDANNVEAHRGTPSANGLNTVGAQYIAPLQTITFGVESTLHLIQALAAGKWRDPPRVWLVTQGAQPVREGDEISVMQAPLWGFGKTIAVEHSEFWGGLIDLESSADADSLWAEIANPSAEDQIAFRGGQRYVARLTRSNIVGAHGDRRKPLWGDAPVKHDASYLITGGLGGIGLVLAKWLAEKGAKHIILMGRTPLSPREQWGDLDPDSRAAYQVNAIREIEALGANVHVAAVDVADEAQLSEFLNAYQRDYPAVRGVFHAAGVMQYESMRDHSAESMQKIFAPKVQGAWLLHKLLPDLDLFVLFSSTSALLSSPLMSSYAAANTFLDALAHYRKSQGLPALSVNWGTWGEAGMATRFDADERSVTVTGTISNAKGLEALERLLKQDSAQVGVMPIDWEQWQKLYPAFTKAPLLQHLVHQESGSGSTAKKVRETVLTADFDARDGLLQAYIIEQLGRILGFSAASIDPRQSILNLGLDSLMAVELKNRIETDLGVVTPMVQILQGPSVVELSAFLLDHVGGELQTAEAEITQDWEEGEL